MDGRPRRRQRRPGAGAPPGPPLREEIPLSADAGGAAETPGPGKSAREWTAVVLAAGRGTRMRSSRPKVLHEAAGRPMLRLVADAARGAGLRRLVVVSAPDARAELAGALEGGPDPVAVAVQAEPLGTGHAALCAEEAAAGAEHVLITYGDLPLLTAGTLRELMERHLAAGAALTFLTATLDDPAGYGRVLRRSGRVEAIVEEGDADAPTRAIPEVNAGLYVARASWLWPALAALEPGPRGEIYLTDLVGRAVSEGAVVETSPLADASEAQQVNTRVELASAEQALRGRVRRRLMESGVTLVDPASTFVDVGVEVGQDARLWPGVHLSGTTRVGPGSEIGPHAVLHDVEVGERCRVEGATLRSSTLRDDVEVGPYCLVRPGCVLDEGVHLGSYAELKNARVGAGTQIGHFSYIGDSVVGARVNIGAGVVTANYDGERKHVTRIGDGAFIGSDTTLVAPVTVGAGAYTGAGAVVVRDVAPGERVAGVPARALRGRGAGGGPERSAVEEEV